MTKEQTLQDQIALQLSVETKPDSDIILTGASNASALEWLDYWPNWPGPARSLNIFGPEGSGKSRLAKYFATKTGAISVKQLKSFSSDMFQTPHLILDGVEQGENWDAEALFHLFNWIAEQAGSLLILSRVPATRIDWGLRDLESRLKTAATQEIYLPDDAYLADYLQHLFAMRQCHIPPSVVAYISSRIPRHFGFAMKLVDTLDTSSLEQKKPISLKLVKTVLADLEEQEL